MYRVPERIYRTLTGRLVRHGHPEAAFLAFPAGMELSDEEAGRTGVLTFATEAVMRGEPLNKARPRTTDKADGAPVSPIVAPASPDPLDPVVPAEDETVVVGPVGAATGVEEKPVPASVPDPPVANQPAPTRAARRTPGSRYR